MADCTEVLDQLCDAIEDDLEAAFCAELQAHLADCPDCKVYVDSVKKTVYLYRQMPRPGMPDDARERLHKALKLPK